jgi:hypothetical protein
MEHRSRTRLLRSTGLVAALLTLLVPATAGAATAHSAKRKTAKSPVITRVSPLSAHIGDTLTIRGRNFRPGRLKNTVVFKRDRGSAMFVKAEIGTKRLIKVTLPVKLATSLAVSNDTPVPTRFRLRVLTTTLSKAFTSTKRSPVIGPALPKSTTPAAARADGDCDGDGQINSVDTDDDNDLLPDTTEVALKLDPCKSDTDGDGVTDGYEYRSALDLNDDDYQNPNLAVPFPGKRPYPNPLDSSDANTDFDGDSLTLTEEYRLWKAYGDPAAGLDNLNYSDGKQYSQNISPIDYVKQNQFIAWATATGYLDPTLRVRDVSDIRDFNRDGTVDAGELAYYHRGSGARLNDAERDEDGDGLTNYTEAHGQMAAAAYWTTCYGEGAFHIGYAGTDLADPDTDGDGILDGADDQDHDDVPNLMELSRIAASGRSDAAGADCTLATDAVSSPTPWWGRVDPFNPCEPDPQSRTCPIIAGAWGPWTDASDKFGYYFATE